MDKVVVVVCHFAPKYLADILVKVLSSANDSDVRWTLWSPDKELGADDRKVLAFPFVLCECKRDLRRLGVKCPYEFIVERNDLVHIKTQPLVTRLKERVKVIEAISGCPSFEQVKDWFAGTFRRYLCLDERVHGNTGYLELKDGKSVCDTNSLLAENPSDEIVSIRQKLDERFGEVCSGVDAISNGDEMLRLRPLMKVLFDDSSNSHFDKGLLKDGKINADVFKMWANGIYGESSHECIPRGNGERIRYVTPTGRLNVLRIDDDLENDESTWPFRGVAMHRIDANPGGSSDPQSLGKEIEHYKGEIDRCQKYIDSNMREPDNDIRREVRRLRKVKTEAEKKLSQLQKAQGDNGDSSFYVHQMKVKTSDLGKRGLVRTVEQNLKWAQQRGLSYDLVVLDLNLGDKREGSDLSGYHLIKVLKKCLPNVPIAIYSKSTDMGHIVRAFQCGAAWYLKKSEPEKIKRHVMELFKRSVWQEDWRAMRECDPVEFEYDCKSQAFRDRFERHEDWKYLTAKCLEYYPGKFITVSEMGGGLSTAVTFKARKGLRLDGCDLQAPVIVKIDTAYNTHMEYERYFRWIRPYMSNASGRIESPGVVLDRDTSAIVYTFAGRNDGSHKLVSLKEMIECDILFRSSCDYRKYERVFDMLFDDILPKIHRVTPNREFGSGENNRHVEVYSRPDALDAKQSDEAFFPNAAFGEVEGKDSWRPYVRRFPVFRKYKLGFDARFVDQPNVAFDQDPEKTHLDSDSDFDNENAVERLVYHEWKDGKDSERQIVAYDKDDRQVVLSGPVVDHIARFRHLVQPGNSLWLKKGSTDKIVEEDESCLSGLEETKLKRYKELIGSLVDLGKAIFPLQDAQAAGNGRCDARCLLIASKSDLFKCPLAVCHGDLNFGNIMVEQSAVGIADPWLIDFARTRRDLIAHDFNVLFTATFSLLFKSKLFEAKEGEKEEDGKATETGNGNKVDGGNGKSKGNDADHEGILNHVLPRFIKDVLFAENENPPDYIASDARMTFVYQILMRIRRAAMKAGISRHMYVLTTALESLMAVRLHLKHGKRDEKNKLADPAALAAADAFIKVSDACYKWLEKELELSLVEGVDKGGGSRHEKCEAEDS